MSDQQLTDQQLIAAIAGNPVMTKYACLVIRSAIAFAESMFDEDRKVDAHANALAFSLFLPRPLSVETELAKVEAQA